MQTATTGLIVITGGCIDQAQDLVIGGREREILSRYETTYEIATQSVRMAATGIDRIEADDWQAAEPKLRTSRELAQRSIGRFRETYQQARFIANTKVQRSVTESWTKV
ncbi:MAG: hypothetical protein SVG88_05720, partial [Halobacteriales archaeon]|nr:hypothetical protein [Halobacteriales archaeon]